MLSCTRGCRSARTFVLLQNLLAEALFRRMKGNGFGKLGILFLCQRDFSNVKTRASVQVNTLLFTFLSRALRTGQKSSLRSLRVNFTVTNILQLTTEHPSLPSSTTRVDNNSPTWFDHLAVCETSLKSFVFTHDYANTRWGHVALFLWTCFDEKFTTDGLE